MTGWGGTATGALLWHDAIPEGPFIPEGKYLLGDAEFMAIPKLLTPYPGVQYHLAERGHGHFKTWVLPQL